MPEEEIDLERRAKSDRRKKIIALSAVGVILAIPVAGYLILWSLLHVSPSQASQNFNAVLEIVDFDESGDVLDEDYRLATDLFGNSRYDGVIAGSEAYSTLSDKLVSSQAETGLSCETTEDRYTSCNKELFSIRLFISEESGNTVLAMNDNGKEKRFEN